MTPKGPHQQRYSNKKNRQIRRRQMIQETVEGPKPSSGSEKFTRGHLKGMGSESSDHSLMEQILMLPVTGCVSAHPLTVTIYWVTDRQTLKVTVLHHFANRPDPIREHFWALLHIIFSKKI